nr:30S ribosomal protein S6 [Clostridia bacterium]
IFRPNLDTDEIEKLIEKFDESLAALDVKIVSRDKIGRKKLAYDIKNFRDGYFVDTIVTVPAENISELKTQMKHNENILRTMFLEVSAEPVNA